MFSNVLVAYRASAGCSTERAESVATRAATEVGHFFSLSVTPFFAFVLFCFCFFQMKRTPIRVCLSHLLALCIFASLQRACVVASCVRHAWRVLRRHPAGPLALAPARPVPIVSQVLPLLFFFSYTTSPITSSSILLLLLLLLILLLLLLLLLLLSRSRFFAACLSPPRAAAWSCSAPTTTTLTSRSSPSDNEHSSNFTVQHRAPNMIVE